MAYLGSFSTGLNITAKFPCTTYGDFIVRKGLNEGKCDFTVQHNLAEFQKRLGLVPVLAGFPIPAFHPRGYGINGMLQSYENVHEDAKNRNLICSELAEEENTVRLFTVTDKSDRKQLFEVELEFSNITTPETDTDFIKLRKTPKNVEIFQLENEAYELKIFEGFETRKIFIRRNGGLDFFDSNEKKVYKLFEDNVMNFFQIPGLNDEIMILDGQKRIWYGEMGTQLLRKKTNFEPNAISPTTCPRTLLAAENDVVNLVDLRENRPFSSEFFKLPDESEFYPAESLAVVVETEMFSDVKEKILHLSTIPGRNYSTICTTNFHHFLLDQRIPNIPILIMPHSILQNDANNFVTKPMKDTVTGNYVHNFFSLSHTNSSEISYWPILIDVKENLWSSISSLKILPKHEIIGKYYQNFIPTDDKRFNVKVLPRNTNAFCYQNIPKQNSTTETALIFQQMDDGDIWYSNFIMNPKSNDEIDPEPMRKMTFEFIQEFYEKADSKDYFLKNTMEELLSNDLQQNVKDHIKVINVMPRKSNLLEIEEYKKVPEKFDPIARLRKVKANVMNPDDFKPKMEVDENDYLGKIILNTWKQTGVAYKKYLKELAEGPSVEVEEDIFRGIDETIEEVDEPEEEEPMDEYVGFESLMKSPMASKSPVIQEDEEELFDFGDLPC